MKAIPFFLFLILISHPLKAQLQESFSDGDITNNPNWTGNTNDFVVNNAQLQLNNPDASGTSTSFLSVKAPTSLDEPTVWQFSFQLGFAPSGTNQLRIYLAANQAYLEEADQAYYLEIGESGNEDAIALYVQDQDVIQLLAKGTAGAVAVEPVNVSLEVRRSQEGEWSLLADYSGGNVLTEEFLVRDTTFSVLTYFGFWCKYSSTRSDAFFFDDILIDPLYADRLPPSIMEVNAVSANQVKVLFDEALAANSVSNPANYFIRNGIGMPDNITFQESRPTEVLLNLATNLISTQEYTLSVQNVQDLNQNTLSEQTFSFVFYDIQPASPGDLLISEVMADPSPSQGLPEEEYFELYNASEKVIQLSSLMIASGSSFQQLPDFLLLPGSYVTVCDDDDLEAFATFGPAVAVRSLPSLSNSDQITVSDLDTNLIFNLAYEQNWYDADPLPQGGISLEIIEVTGPADCPSNWAAARSNRGGTPGNINSVAGLSTENSPPSLEKLEVVDEFELRITFSERMNQNNVLTPSFYSFSPLLDITEILPGIENEVIIFLTTPLGRGQTYILNLSNAITDCIGNSIGTNRSFVFGLPEEAEPGDLLLNEILFNPQTGGDDFIEIFNRSNKVVNLKNWILENAQKESGNALQIFDHDFLVFPQEYVVLTSEPKDILMRYQVPAPDRLVKNNLPTLDARKGNITLRRPDSLIIESFDYDEDLHFSLLENPRGVSLERLSFEQSAQSRGNWHSAAESSGFATPTGPNSQQGPISQGADLVNIENPRFSPDNDGFEDILLIHIEPERSGYVANIKVFDAQGRLVRDLVRNSILGNSEVYKWDGMTNENSKARIGPYVVWIELFQPDGEVITEKKTIVVAGKL